MGLRQHGVCECREPTGLPYGSSTLECEAAAAAEPAAIATIALMDDIIGQETDRVFGRD